MSDLLIRALGGTGETGQETGRDLRARGWDGTRASLGRLRALSVSRGGEDSGEDEFLDKHSL